MTTKRILWGLGVAIALVGIALSYIISNPSNLGLTDQALAWVGVANAVVVAAVKILPGGLVPPPADDA